MVRRLLLGSLVGLACAARPLPAVETPVATSTPAQAATPAASPEPGGWAEAAPLTPPSDPPGDRLTLMRGWCYGSCPIYTLHLYADGRVIWHGEEHVSRIGTLRATIPEAAARALMAEVDGLDHEKLAKRREDAACGTDMPAVALGVRRGEAVRAVVVDLSCLLSSCEKHDRACREREARRDRDPRGRSRAAMQAAWDLADKIDRTVPTLGWIADPDCANLLGESIAVGQADPAAKDDPAWQIRERSYDRLIAALKADTQVVVRIAAIRRPKIDGEIDQHYRTLVARGIDERRIGVHFIGSYPEPLAEPVVLTVGPRKCFGETFPDGAGG